MIIPLSFAGKKVIVTGAGRGLGKLLVKAIIERDGDVFALSRTKERLDQLQAEHPSVKTICVDLTNWNETRKVVDALEPVHMLVNNAGVNIPGEIAKVTQEDFHKTFDTNVLSPLNLTQMVAEKMISNRYNGSIVNISSLAERTIFNKLGLYGMSKSALGMMSRSFALELGPHNIRVNCVAPGIFPSDMSKKALDNPKSRLIQGVLTTTPLRRIATVEEVVNVVLFLLHDSSSYVTGQSVFVCGGATGE